MRGPGENATLRNFERHHDDAKRRRLTLTGTSSGGVRKKKWTPKKNVNAEVYASNAKYRTTCMICGGKKARLVNHYVKEHPNKEVFISRISPEMRTLALAGLKRARNYGSFFETFCIFCEKIFRKQKCFWVQHITTHTGEYQNYCKGCRMTFAQTSHHKAAKLCSAYGIEQIRVVKEENDAIYGFICNLCNYVQIHEEPMIQHVKDQHEFETDLKSHYTRFKMLNLTAGFDGKQDSDDCERVCTTANTNRMALYTNPPSNCVADTNHTPVAGSVTNNETLLNKPVAARPLISALEKPAIIPPPEAEVSKTPPQQQQPPPVCLKPWTKSIATKYAHIAKYMLRDCCHFNLFKCMFTNCPFSSKSKEQMLQHLQLHQQLENSSINNGDSRLHLECAYCMDLLATCEELVQHVEVKHRSSIFMCQHCFYRSADVFGLLIHLQKYHRQMSEIILVGNVDQKIDLPQEIPLLFAQWKQNIASIACNRGRSF